MSDVVSREVRSRMMSGIRGKDTRPEMVLRRALHHEGFRYRLHVSGMLGKPDIVLPKFKAVIFVNGCFWHGHDCRYFKWPKSRADFWRRKITLNRERDVRNESLLRGQGWRICKVWECSLRQPEMQKQIFYSVSEWLRDLDNQFLEIRGGA